ncbi:MAG TPA: riboflavin synthase [Chitinophagaceae bacterium]|nr:riboflavin synthase [Chitinophagaceae bacterium]
MFTGIIETTGQIENYTDESGNRTFWINSPLSSDLKIDQSVSHDGVCLTVEEVKGNSHRVTAIAETLKKSGIGSWEKGRLVNIERCMLMNGRLDGHIVLGHVDTTGKCISKKQEGNSWQFVFQISEEFSTLIIEKGSISINGISLTIFNIKKNEFEVAIIPYTYEHTNMRKLEEGDVVNIEFDVIGKYVNRILEVKGGKGR